jgi:hypothetical protein
MSLDIYLTVPIPIKRQLSSGIFIRENGTNKEISEEEWNARFPDRVAHTIQPEGGLEGSIETTELKPLPVSNRERSQELM